MQAEGSPHYRPILVNISVIGIHKGEEGQGILHSMLQFVLPRQMQPGYCREIVAHSDGRYYPIADLIPHSLHNIVSTERSSLLPRDILAMKARGEQGSHDYLIFRVII